MKHVLILYFEIIFIGTLKGILFEICIELSMYNLLMNFLSQEVDYGKGHCNWEIKSALFMNMNFFLKGAKNIILIVLLIQSRS